MTIHTNANRPSNCSHEHWQITWQLDCLVLLLTHYKQLSKQSNVFPLTSTLLCPFIVLEHGSIFFHIIFCISSEKTKSESPPFDKYIYKSQRFTGGSKAPRESWAIWAYDTYHTSWNNELRNLGDKVGVSIVSCVFQSVFSISHILCYIYALLLWDRLVLKSLSFAHGTLGGAGIFEN